ncbi:MAG: hypothetical protein AB1546_02075 [bacterium]
MKIHHLQHIRTSAPLHIHTRRLSYRPSHISHLASYISLITLLTTLMVSVSFYLTGCAGGKGEGAATKELKEQSAPLLSEEILKKISQRVLADVPNTERLRQVQKMGILRVGLPPFEIPFQYMNEEMDLMVGFNVDMTDEIARILGAKTNLQILDWMDGNYQTGSTNGRLDIFIFNTGEGHCNGGTEVPTFYFGHGKGWQKICIPDADRGMAEAIKQILDYLDETGIYARIYRNYFVSI